jgi:hypothetical protein
MEWANILAMNCVWLKFCWNVPVGVFENWPSLIPLLPFGLHSILWPLSGKLSCWEEGLAYRLPRVCECLGPLQASIFAGSLLHPLAVEGSLNLSLLLDCLVLYIMWSKNSTDLSRTTFFFFFTYKLTRKTSPVFCIFFCILFWDWSLREARICQDMLEYQPAYHKLVKK